MKIEKQYLDDHQMKLTVEVEQGLLENAKLRAARKLAQKTKIPGFRPGKAPYAVVLRAVGEGAVVEEALDILVQEVYPQALDQSEIKPYGPGNLENMPSMEPLTFEFVVPLQAEVTLGNYQAIRIPYELAAIKDEDVERVLQEFRSRQAILEPVSRPALEGDEVYTRLSGERTQPEEGESSSLFNERPYQVIIRGEESGNASEWPFPGFSRKLIGMSVKEECTVVHVFPDDADFESLRGKEAEFHVVVEEIKSRTLPELNDEFAHTVNEQYATLDELRDAIRKSLEEQSSDEYNQQYNDKIVAELLKDAVLKYPPQMLEHEIELFENQLANRLSQQGMEMETYLKMRQMDHEALHAEMKPMAEARLQRTLVMLEVARSQDIKVTEEEVEVESMRALDELSHMLPADKARKTLNNDFVRGMIGNISSDLLIKRIWAYLHTVAKGDLATTGTTDLSPTNDQVASETVEKTKKRKSKSKVKENE